MTEKHTNWRGVCTTALVATLVGCSLVLTSCYPGDEFTPADADVVVTTYEPEYDFSTKFTYAMPDSISHVGQDSVIVGGGEHDEQILARIEENLAAMGYTRVMDETQADVLVVNFITQTLWVAGGCYPWYWGWWYPYPGWCYPVAYTFETGTLLTLMVDPNETRPEAAAWIAGINGLTGYADVRVRIDQNIDQAFVQSPYLGAGK